MAYARMNLGDDLFIKMIVERYPMHEFYMKISNYEFLKKIDQYPNMHVLEGEDTDEELYNSNVDEYDVYIYVGGSIFMEGGKVYNLSEKFYDFVERCKMHKKPFLYVSCNYGPFKTQEYLNLSKRNFKSCTDICFRDLYSYNMFKDIETVRYAPDFAFTYQINNDNMIKNSIGISLIDLSIREELKNKQEDYLKLLINNISNYIEKGKDVYLYSFCQYEGDEKTISFLMNEFKGNEYLHKIQYNGDIDEFIKMYSKMEYMICSRFHSLVLSCISKQKIFVISYSKKIDNIIKDLEMDLPVIHFEDITSNDVIDLEQFCTIENEKLENIISKAHGQELAVKTILNDKMNGVNYE